MPPLKDFRYHSNYDMEAFSEGIFLFISTPTNNAFHHHSETDINTNPIHRLVADSNGWQ